MRLSRVDVIVGIVSATLFWQVIELCISAKVEKSELSYRCTVRNDKDSCAKFIDKWPDNSKEQRHLDFLMNK